ncbi:MAG: hypothetical protein V4712_15030 [Pseudomonadota bacterium]
MSLHDCLQRAIDSKDLPPAMARRAQTLFADRLQAHASLGQGAEAKAAEDVWVFLRKENIRKRRGAFMQAKAQMRIADDLARHRDSDGQANAATGMRQLVEWGQSASFQSVSGIQQALSSSYMRDISELIATHKINIVGNARQKMRMPNLVRELKGEHTGDPHAKSMADAARATIERARQENIAAGGEIGKLEGYDLPHHWDRVTVGKANEAEFVADFYDRMDWTRIIDRETELPFAQSSNAARLKFLGDIHRNIKSGGSATTEPSGAVRGRSLAKSRSDPRVLHFKTADGWLDMNAKYGVADPYSAIVTHLQGMARDTAMMRVLGPNPRAGLEYARQAAVKLANERPWEPTRHIGLYNTGKSLYDSAEAEVNGVASQTERMLDMINGAASVPEMNLFASFMSNGVRPFLVASQLGGAMLSAVGDIGFLGRAAYHTGAKPSRMIAKHLGYVMERVGETAVSLASMGTVQRNAVEARMARLGIIAESASNTGVVQARLMGEAWTPGIMQRMSEFTMRASGLTAWTDIARGVFKMETYGTLAENAGRPWADIDAPLRDLVLAPRGITPAEWDVIRATPLYADPGDPRATFLIPDDIRRRADLPPDQALDLSLKLQSAILEQREFAVPTASLRGRATIQVGKPGTLGGEFLQSALMYKNYPLTLMYNQMGRMLYHKVRGNRFMAAVVPFVMLTTIGGAISTQLKEVGKGRDPRDMTEWRFWKAAMLQGGGLGIFGDFLYASENRFGGGFASTAAGSVVGTMSSAGSLITDGMAALKGDAKAVDAFQRNAIGFANKLGGPTNLWYLNAAFDRLVWDSLTLWADPNATKAMAAKEKKRIKEYGNGAFWPTGQALPSRLPDLSAMFGATS